tara:strand:- start:253 stop:504 length:252 start_codon:yes stop_codon:yes gene_type:complete
MYLQTENLKSKHGAPQLNSLPNSLPNAVKINSRDSLRPLHRSETDKLFVELSKKIEQSFNEQIKNHLIAHVEIPEKKELIQVK